MFLARLLEEPLRGITLLYGPGASGKSTACLEMIQGKTAYIATAHNFSAERLSGMRPDVRLDKIALFQTKDLPEVERAIEQAVALSPALSVIIVDSLATYVRVAPRRAANLALERILTTLGKASCPVLLVSDALDDPEREGELRFVGGDLLRLHARSIVEMKTGTATVKKHPSVAGRVRQYAITAEGLESK